MDVVAMIKKSSRIDYLFEGKLLSIMENYSRNNERRIRSKNLLSIEVYDWKR